MLSVVPVRVCVWSVELPIDSLTLCVLFCLPVTLLFCSLLSPSPSHHPLILTKRVSCEDVILLDMTFDLCLRHARHVCPSLPHPSSTPSLFLKVPKATRLDSRPSCVCNHRLSFFYPHLPSRTFSPPPPFLQFSGSCLHGWTENVPGRPRNVSSPLSVCVCYNQLQHLVMEASGVASFLFVGLISHDCFLTSLFPSYVQWMFLSMH